MSDKIIDETLEFLKNNPDFLKTYFEYIKMAQTGDQKAKQLVDTIISANPDMFIVINEIIKMASEGDAQAKGIILDNLGSNH
jgi:hypothetical protein